MSGLLPAGPPNDSGQVATAPRPRRLLGRLYAEEREAWRKHYRRYFKHAARALGLGFVAGFAFFMLRPGQEDRALALVVRALEDISLEGPPLKLALTLFYHNARASVIAVGAGLVPFLFLPIFDPIINGGVLGLLASVGKHQGLDVARLFLTKVLPHGVFELTAVLYATSLGLYLSAEMGKKARKAWKSRRGTRLRTPVGGTCPQSSPQSPQASAQAPTAPLEFLETYPQRLDAEPKGAARNVVRSFVLVVLPLLLIAAAIEGLVTPHLR
jgi:stage II sporulation protein M